MDDGLEVKFGADTAGLEQGADKAKGEIKAVSGDVAALQQVLAGMRAQLEQAFATPDANGLSASVGGSTEALELMRGVIEGMEAELKDALNPGTATQFAGSAEQATAAVNELRNALATGSSVSAETVAALGGVAGMEQLVAEMADDADAAMRRQQVTFQSMIASVREDAAMWGKGKVEREAWIRTTQQTQELMRNGISLTEQQSNSLREENRLWVEQKYAAQAAEREAARSARAGHDRVTGATGALGMIRGAIGPLMAAVGAAFSVQQIGQWVKHVAEGAEKVHLLSERLGLAVEDVQRLQAMGAGAGIPIDRLAASVAQLDANFAKAKDGSDRQAAAFRALGIDTSQSYTQMELLRAVMDRFSTMDNGPRKVAIAMALMGQNGAAMIPILNQGAAGFDKLNAKLEAYGVINAEAVAAGLELDEAMDDNALAMKGLSNTFAAELGPSIAATIRGINDLVKGWVKSYNEGGVVKKFLEGLAYTFRLVIVVLVSLWQIGDQVFSRLWGVIQMFVTGMKVKFAEAKGACEVLGIGFKLLGLAMLQGLIGPWPQIQKAMDDNLALMVKKVAATNAEMRRIAAEGAAGFDGTFAGADQRWDQANTWAADFLDNGGTGTPAGAPPGNSGLGSTGGLGAGAGSSAASKSRVEKWREELHSMQIASGEFFKDQTRSELEFWTGKLALTRSGSKEWLQIQELIFDAKKKLAQDAYSEEIALLDEAMDNARQNNAEQARLMAEKVEKVRATYGEESNEFKAAMREQRRLAKEHQDELVALTVAGIEQRETLARIAVDTEAQIAEDAAAVEEVRIAERERRGQITATRAAQERQALNDRLYRMQVDHENRLFELALASLMDQLRANAGRGDVEAEINRKIEEMRAQHYARIAELDSANGARMVRDQSAVAAEVESHWKGVFGPIGDGFGAMVSNMVTGAKSWADIWNNIGAQMLQNITTWLARVVTEWLAAEMAKTGITLFGETTREGIKVGAAAVDTGIELAKLTTHVGAETLKTAATLTSVGIRTGAEVAGGATTMGVSAAVALADVANSAVRAAAGAYAAVAGIPIIGPFLAPVMAAVALGAVLALGKSIFSAEGGFGEVPFDGAQTTLHKKEMVLPAWIAQPLRQAVTTGSFPGADGSAQGGGGRPVQFNISAIDQRGVRSFLQRYAPEIVSVLSGEARNFNFGGAGN